MDTVLSVNGLGKSFKNKQVVQGISFDVRKGEIMAILGPNGAGKSTTIRNIMGIMHPDEGEITFHGYKKNEIPRDKIGYLPEERGLYKNVKVMDMILYLADLKNYPKAKARERAMHYLKRFDLEGKESTSLEELSKGMGQKVQFIASVIHEPELLILDEPFSGLDPVSQDVFKEEIKKLADEGTAILLSSHQMNVVEQLCDRLLMISRGRKVIDGRLEEVKNEYGNFKCAIKGDNELHRLEEMTDVERVEEKDGRSILHLAHDVHIPLWLSGLPTDLHIQELAIDRISLHEIFIRIATEQHQLVEGVEGIEE